MKKKLIAAPVIGVIIFFVFALASLANGTTVFWEDFSSGNFAAWSRSFQSQDSTQTVSGGVARYIVPTPPSGTMTYSYVVKDGFTSTVNSTITASQNILVTKVPSGFAQGNSAIFFLYLCDSSDLAGNCGNFGVGIDGSGVWSLWIGGNQTYTYVFQTDGSAPASNTWYHVALTVDNSAGTVKLAVNGETAISATQQQFTDKTHAISLMCGVGENWWSQTSGQLEIDVDNVQLEISNAASPNPTFSPTSPANPTFSQPHTIKPTPNTTATPTPSPAPTPSISPDATPSPQKPSQDSFPLWVLLPLVIVVFVCLEVLFMLKKR